MNAVDPALLLAWMRLGTGVELRRGGDIVASQYRGSSSFIPRFDQHRRDLPFIRHPGSGCGAKRRRTAVDVGGRVHQSTANIYDQVLFL